MHSRNQGRALLFITLFILMAARGEAQDFDGDWSGSSGTRTFSVVNDRIVEFSFRAQVFAGSCTATVTVSGTASVPIVSNSFSFAPAVEGTLFIISGTFQTFTSVRGSLLVFGTPCSVLALFSWSATKVGDDTISILIGDGQVVEGDFGFTAGELEVTLDKMSSQQVSVDYATRGGTAEGDADYATSSGTLTFSPGETSKMAIVEAIGDSLPEFPESFFVDLSGATNAKVFDTSGFGLIVDDDDEEQPAVLEFVEAHFDGEGGVDGLNGAASVTVSPDGRHVYVAGDIDDGVAVFERHETFGALTFVEVQSDGDGGVDGLNGATSVTVSPDGGHVYVAGDIDDAVAAFERNGTTGALTFVEVHVDGIGGVSGLAGASSAAVSPDGGHVYVTSSLDDAVVAFERQPVTGTLSFVEVIVDGIGGVDGLDGASAVTVSPDGNHVYVTGGLDDALAVFNRDSASGVLSFKEVHHDDLGGLDGPDFVTLSPGGNHVFVACSGSDSVAVFNRDPSTGTLSFSGAQFGGAGPVEGLDSAQSVAVSPDGNHVYAAASVDDAVTIFTTAEVIVDLPVADFTFSPTSPEEGEEVHFADTSSGEPTSWSWDFGDSTVSTARNPVHTYTEAGTYTVTLTVSNSGGSDSTSAEVTVESSSNCVRGPTVMCLNSQRFMIEVDWRDFAGSTGSGQVVPFGSDDSGILWFFDSNNWEMLVKVLGGCAINDRFWVFAASTTNVEYTLKVTDTETGAVTEYFNPLGAAATAITDTDAFATCP